MYNLGTSLLVLFDLTARYPESDHYCPTKNSLRWLQTGRLFETDFQHLNMHIQYTGGVRSSVGLRVTFSCKYQESLWEISQKN